MLNEIDHKMIYGLCQKAVRTELTTASEQFAKAQEPLVEAVIAQREDIGQLIAATRVMQETLKTLIDQLDAIYGGKSPDDESWWKGETDEDAEP